MASNVTQRNLKRRILKLSTLEKKKKKERDQKFDLLRQRTSEESNERNEKKRD